MYNVHDLLIEFFILTRFWTCFKPIIHIERFDNMISSLVNLLEFQSHEMVTSRLCRRHHEMGSEKSYLLHKRRPPAPYYKGLIVDIFIWYQSILGFREVAFVTYSWRCYYFAWRCDTKEGFFQCLSEGFHPHKKVNLLYFMSYYLVGRLT